MFYTYVVNNSNSVFTGCQCGELQDKLSKLEMKYSELEMNYLQKVNELQDLTSKLKQFSSVNSCHLDSQPTGSKEISSNLPMGNPVACAKGSLSEESRAVSQIAENVSKKAEAKNQVAVQVGPPQPDMKIVLKKLNTVEESRSRLKEKTKSLLRQYRDKRALLERRERQLIGQRAGLQQLQLLLRSQNSCQLLVLRHTASHLKELARLLAALNPDCGQVPPLIEENVQLSPVMRRLVK